VIVTLGDSVAMQPTVKEALAELTVLSSGGGPDTGEPLAGGDTTAAAQGWGPLADRAMSEYDRSQTALRSGDFTAYGRELKALGDTLRRMQRMKGGGSENSVPQAAKEPRPPTKGNDQ